MTCSTLVRNGSDISTVGYSSTRLLTQFGLSADVSVAKIKQKAKHLKFISLFFLLFRFWYKILFVESPFLLFISDLLCIWAPRFFILKVQILAFTIRNGVTIWYTPVYPNEIQYAIHEWTVLTDSFVIPNHSPSFRVTNCHAYNMQHIIVQG